MVVMGSRIFWVMFCLSALVFVEGLNEYDSESLDVFVLQQAWKALARPYTGRLYRVHLPANFSAMEVSVIRLRSRSLWAKGVNFSYIYIPPGTLTVPHVKRLAIVYENLGNLSSDYYKLPGFSLVSPVLGFMAYDGTNLSFLGNLKINFSILNEPISVHFPGNFVPKQENDIKCVTFGDDGSVQFSNMTAPNVCFAKGQGHFAVAVPAQPMRKHRWWKWWAVGLGSGFAGLVMVAVAVLAIVKVVKTKKLEEMERKSENSEALNSILIGRSKVPTATMIRTQPVLENAYVP